MQLDESQSMHGFVSFASRPYSPIQPTWKNILKNINTKMIITKKRMVFKLCIRFPKMKHVPFLLLTYPFIRIQLAGEYGMKNEL
jgi:hypothetical protein